MSESMGGPRCLVQSSGGSEALGGVDAPETKLTLEEMLADAEAIEQRDIARRKRLGLTDEPTDVP
jgi:hypothetical protein